MRLTSNLHIHKYIVLNELTLVLPVNISGRLPIANERVYLMEGNMLPRTWWTLSAFSAVLIIALFLILMEKPPRTASNPPQTELQQQTQATEKSVTPRQGQPPSKPAAKTRVAQSPAPAKTPAGLPRLIQFTEDGCSTCDLMKPIIKSLDEKYAGKLRVDTINMGDEPDAKAKYKIVGKPTQIFFDGNGKEIFRHVSYMTEEQIIAKFNELGIKL